MWYNKFDLKKRDGAILCPNCNYVNEEQILYSLEGFECNNCTNSILFIRAKGFIYTFDLNNAPSLFIKMYEELRSKSMKEAYAELFEVTEVFCPKDFKKDGLS